MNTDVKQDFDYKLASKRLGITEDDVLACTDIYNLLRWQIEVSKDIASIDAQTTRRKNVGIMDDPEWSRRAASARRLLELFVDFINVRVSELKTTKTRFAEAYLEASRRELDVDTFQRVMEAAQTDFSQNKKKK